MTLRRRTYAFAARALRVALAFAVAFGTSLGVELAVLSLHAQAEAFEGSITGLELFESPDGQVAPGSSPIARSANLPQAGSGSQGVSIDSRNGKVRIAAQLHTVDGDGHAAAVDAAGYVSWSISDEDLASIDEGTGEIEAAGKNGTATVACRLKPAYEERTNSETREALGDAPLEARFLLTVKGQEPAHVASIEFCDGDGKALESKQAQVAAGQQLPLRVLVSLSREHEGLESTYVCTPDASKDLKAQTAGALPELQWSVSPADAASIEGEGVTPNGTAPFTVTCSIAKDSERSQPERSDELSVAVGQGAEDAEDEELRIDSVEILKADGASFGGDKTLELEVGAETTYQFRCRIMAINPAREGSRLAYEYSGDAWTVAKDDGPAETLLDLPFDIAWTAAAQAQEEDPSQQACSIDPQKGLLTLRADSPVSVSFSAHEKSEGAQAVEDTVVVNPKEDGSEPQQPDGKLHVFLSYNPVPRGKTAYISSFIQGMRGIIYTTRWFESADGGATWTETGTAGMQTLSVLTDEPYIGRLYQARVKVLSSVDHPEQDPDAAMNDPDGWVESEPVQIVEGPGGVTLNVDYVFEGQDALFRSDVDADFDASAGPYVYLWEKSTDGAQTWSELKRGNYPTYSVLTERERLGTLFRVRLVAASALDLPYTELESHVLSTSNLQMLAALANDENNPLDPTPDSGNEPDGASPGKGASDAGSSDSTPAGESGQAQQPQTLSEAADKYGSASITLPKGKHATVSPLGHIRMDDEQQESTDQQAAPDLHIDEGVSEAVAQQESEQLEHTKSTQPGARWNPIYIKQNTDVAEQFEANGIALLTGPLCIALLCAGALEKTLRYREQKRSATNA